MKKIALILVLCLFCAGCVKSPVLIGNKNTKKFHLATCRYVKKIEVKNIKLLGEPDNFIKSGYIPCKVCNPIKGRDN